MTFFYSFSRVKQEESVRRCFAIPDAQLRFIVVGDGASDASGDTSKKESTVAWRENAPGVEAGEAELSWIIAWPNSCTP